MGPESIRLERKYGLESASTVTPKVPTVENSCQQQTQPIRLAKIANCAELGIYLLARLLPWENWGIESFNDYTYTKVLHVIIFYAIRVVLLLS